jgi:Quinolinate phosphoribosyl transferase, N-terminal domain
VSAAPPDRATIAAAVMDDLVTISSLDTDDEAVGVARIVASRGGVFAGAPVVREIMGRVGVRTRSLVAEGKPVVAGTAVLELGGPIAAIRGVAPLALTWVTRCGAVASGATAPEAGNPIDAYAARLSARGAVGHDGPSFRLEIEPDTSQRSEQAIEG